MTYAYFAFGIALAGLAIYQDGNEMRRSDLVTLLFSCVLFWPLTAVMVAILWVVDQWNKHWRPWWQQPLRKKPSQRT